MAKPKKKKPVVGPAFLEGGKLTHQGKQMHAKAEAMKLATAKAMLFGGSDPVDIADLRSWIVDLLCAEIERKWPLTSPVSPDDKPVDLGISAGSVGDLLIWIVRKLGGDPDINPERKPIPEPDGGDATRYQSKTINQIAAFLANLIHAEL